MVTQLTHKCDVVALVDREICATRVKPCCPWLIKVSENNYHIFNIVDALQGVLKH